MNKINERVQSVGQFTVKSFFKKEKKRNLKTAVQGVLFIANCDMQRKLAR